MTKHEPSPLRIATAAMMQETNTFTTDRTVLDDFTQAEGDAVRRVARWKGNGIDAIHVALDGLEVQVMPTFFARALPGGLVLREAYLTIRSRILDGIAASLPLDGICLALHGSMSAEGEDDPEGDLLERIRNGVGPDMPIVCALDMHATLTDRMVMHADGFVAYRTAPHVDEAETGMQAARMLVESIRTGRRIATRMCKVPLLIAGEKTETDVEPTRSLFARLAVEDTMPGVLRTSYVLGFPWADSRHGGCAALVTGLAEFSDTLEEVARRLADRLLEARDDFDFTTEAMEPEEAVDQALADPASPVLVSDSGDNPTAGASQDRTALLRTLVERTKGPAIFAVLADPAAVERCRVAGVGAELSLALGRLDEDPLRPSPYVLAVNVRAIERIKGALHAVVRKEDIDIVLCERRTEVTDPEVLTALGLHPAGCKVVILKSGYLSPAYRRLAGRCLLALTPGDTCEILERLPYQTLVRPIHPLDP